MKLTARTWRQRVDQGALSTDENALARCQWAKELEEAGDYEAAREAMKGLWERVGERPSITGLGERAAAEVLLRAGVLSGWIGSSRQIENSQEAAKDLISESAALFEELGETMKIAEARNELAYCYWREGAFDEARIMLRGVLAGLSEDQSEQKAIALLRSAIVEASVARYNDALRILLGAAPLFEASENHALKGKFHNELANVLNFLSAAEQRDDYRDQALLEYTAAVFHFEQAGHTRYEAAVENNLGYLFISAKRFTEAHRHLDRARRLFTRLKDSVHIAQVDETRARAYLSEGRNEEAEKKARAAVHALEKGDESALLSEALTTHGIALARLGHHIPAETTLRRAIETAQQAGDMEGAGLVSLALIEELADHLDVTERRSLYQKADEFLKDSQEMGTLWRLCRAARSLLAENRSEEKTERHFYRAGNQPSQKDAAEDRWHKFSLKEEVRRLEEHYIQLALRDAGGRVSHAAKLLGFADHGSLNSILKNRHGSLLSARIPATPRRHSIIRKGRH